MCSQEWLSSSWDEQLHSFCSQTSVKQLLLSWLANCCRHNLLITCCATVKTFADLPTAHKFSEFPLLWLYHSLIFLVMFCVWLADANGDGHVFVFLSALYHTVVTSHWLKYLFLKKKKNHFIHLICLLSFYILNKMCPVVWDCFVFQLTLPILCVWSLELFCWSS